MTEKNMDDNRKRSNSNSSTTDCCWKSLFQECFAPLAHHMLPDGWERMMMMEKEEDDDDDNDKTHEAFYKLVSMAWPKHKSDRRTIPSKDAIASIRKLRDYSQQYGLDTTQIAAVLFVACRLLQPQWNNTCNSGSQLVRSSQYFVELIRCILPRKPPTNDNDPNSHTSSNHNNNNEEEGDMISFPTGGISLLLSAITVVDPSHETINGNDKRCHNNEDCKIVVLRLLTLWVRHHHHHPYNSSNNDIQKLLSNHYSILFAMLSIPSIQLDGVRLLYIITRKRHAKSFRAQRLRFLYDQHFFIDSSTEEDLSSTTSSSYKNKNQSSTAMSLSSSSTRRKILTGSSPIYLLLKLYSHYNPEGCGKYLPKKSNYGRERTNHYSKYFHFPDEAWEKDFQRVITISPSDESNQKSLSATTHKINENGNGKSTSNSSDLATKDKDGKLLPQMNENQKKRRKLDYLTSSTSDNKLSETIKKIDDLLDGVRSSSWQLLSGNNSTSLHDSSNKNEQHVNIRNTHYHRRVLRASDLLMDKEVRYCLSLSSSTNNISRTMNTETDTLFKMNASNTNDICQSEVIRLRVCLPFMLREEWYEKEEDEDKNYEYIENKEFAEISSNDYNDGSIINFIHEKNDGNPSNITAAIQQRSTINSGLRKTTFKRLGLIKALASLAKDMDMLPPEAEDFVVDEILPSWDGSDDMGGIILCNDLLSVLSPRSFRDLNRSVLRYLSNLYIGGSVRLKNTIVSGTLSSLIRRWGISSITMCDDSREISKTLHQLIHWTDTLLLSGSISEADDDNNGHELIRHSILNFFNAVCDISNQCNFISLPSPSLINRMLLSNTAASIDRTCTLFLRYKEIFVAAKQKNEEINNKSSANSETNSNKEPVVPRTIIDGIERVAIFNCFIWDFCSALWRSSPLLPDNDSIRGAMNGIRSKSLLLTDLSPHTLPALHRLRDQFDFSTSLSITKSAAFSGYAYNFLDSLPPDQKQKLISTNEKFKNDDELSIDMLTGPLKIRYLEYLNEIGFHGLYSFLTTFVGMLSKHKRRKQIRNNK